MSTILDGKALAAEIRAALGADAQRLAQRLGRPPGLGVILVGEDPGSVIYVRNKEKAAAAAGIFSAVVRLDAAVGTSAVLDQVEQMNRRDDIDGFLVQLPLPAGVEKDAVLERISPDKDADGLHPTNIGRLAAGLPGPRACTPSGVMALLDKAEAPLEGARAVVVGRSVMVGKPMALMLLERNATVTVCHSRTGALAEEVRGADVVVAAVGSPAIIKGKWIQPGATVVDVGMNRVDGKWTGDVEFSVAAERARAITPVPGGVGPLTVAMLLKNTVELAAGKRK